MKQDLHSLVRKCCAAWLLTAFFYHPVFSQTTESSSHFEAGITLGPSNFLGDLGGNAGRGTTFLKDNNFQMTKLTMGAFVSYHPSEYYSLRFAINKGSLEGDDAIIKPKGGLEEARRNRNSNFRSKLLEAFLIAEVYPTAFIEYDPSDVFMKLRPYVVGGIGAFKFNPQGQDPQTGNWVDLQPLRTEGQGFAEYPNRKEYKLMGMNIPLGLGVKYFISENVNVSFEIIHRKTFTDYIDDVSTSYVDPVLFYNYLPLQQAQLAERMANKSLNGVYDMGDKRGTATNNDAYYTAGFKLGFRLGNNNPYRTSTVCPIRF
jgi:hypothetical protein